MANLISSRQIQGVVTASKVTGEFEVSGSSHITGSFNVTGSITSTSTITGNTFVGDGSTLSGVETTGRGIVSGAIQILGGSGIVSGASQLAADFLDTLGDGVISGSSQITYDDISGIPAFIGGTNVTVSSGSGGITINSTGGGGGGSSTDITHLNTYTGSTDARLSNIQSTTSSIEQRVGQIESNTGSYGGGSDTTSLNTFTSSANIKLTNLETFTGSVLLSSSAQITALGFVSESSTPSGTISGSKQITDFGFISSSDSTTSLNTYTASNDINITNIHATTSSLSGRITQLETDTGSQDQRLDSIESVSGSYLTSLDSGIVSGAGQIGGLGYISASQVSSSIGFDGNRTVSNTDLPSGVYNNNFGTSGSIQNFLESVFFPNTSPTINSVSFSIDEFEDINSIAGTISATDAEGQTITYATQSGYSADKFTVHSSTGVITARARTTSSINTDTSVYAGGAHPFLIKATDTFSGTTNKTIHIRVTPNTAPKFREGSASGTVITSVTSSFNENSSDNALVKRVYFTDDESDSITLTSTSIDNNHFDIHKYSNYFDIRQNTGSLDYEVQSLYTFAVTASDEHFLSASQGTVGQTILPISVSVTDNVHPTINNQTLSSISENTSNGAAVATISATDNEGDTITFSDFTLYKLELDNSNVASSSYGGTSHTDPTNDAFQCSGTGAVTRKNGVYINSDLINEYQYTVKIRDSYNTASNEAVITIPISDDTAPTVSDNWTTPYVIESAVSGASVYISSNGRSGTIAAFSANQSVTWTLNSGSGVFDINSSNGRLSIKTNLSGSTTSSGALLSGSSIATNTFGTTTETPFTTSVAANQAPSISFTNQSAKFETDLALNGVTMVSMSVSDDESDTPFSASLSGSNLELVYSNANSSSIGLHLTQNATAREYFYSVTITDQFGKSQTYSDRSFTITTSADYGKTYVYRSDYGSDSGLSTSYTSVMGIDSTSGTPPEVTGFTANDTSPMRLISSSLGDASLSLAGGGTATRVAILSGSNLDTILSASTFSMGGAANQYIVIAPSGSDMIGVPTSMTDSFGGSTAGEYVMAINADGSGWGAENSIIHTLDTSGSINGYDKHFVIGRKGHNAASSVLLRIIASSGSLPS